MSVLKSVNSRKLSATDAQPVWKRTLEPREIQEHEEMDSTTADDPKHGSGGPYDAKKFENDGQAF
jgi:hypothetical protein